MRWQGRLLQKTNGQSVADYVMLITVIGAAFLAMQLFVRRAIQAKLRDMLASSGYNRQSVAQVDVRNAEVEANEIESNLEVETFSQVRLAIKGGKLQFNSYSNSFQNGDEL